MVTVSEDASAVEIDLSAGRLGCPECSGQLRPWGWARRRVIREGWDGQAGLRPHRPRRARCAGCGITHVLLAASVAARRADAVAVIAAAIEAKVAGGLGHRRIAARLERPASTVRGWLRAFASSAEAIAEAFTSWTVRDAPDAAALWPSPSQEDGARALGVLSAYASAVAHRFDVGALTWSRAGITATGGWLFSAPWWARGGQHQLALTGGGAGAGRSR